jgi:HlyD family secretion protein
MNNWLANLLIISLASFLVGCSSNAEQKKKMTQSYVVKTESVHKTLYFTGTIQPLHESTLTSPMDATVEIMHYHFGQTVKKGDIVFTLNSSELQKQFNETLTEYLKAKDNFTVAQAKFTGTQELWKAGLLAKNNYLGEKSSLATARVSLMQASRKLTEMLEKMDEGNTQNVSALSIAEFAKVKEALTSKHNLIQLKAPTAGVLLYPPKSGEDKVGKLTIGSAVKAGQAVALVGDLNGISVEIDVSEIDIDKIHPGMLAKISGVALGNQVLQGELVSVNAQALNTNNSTFPSFSALVEVKSLNEIQRQRVKVGMSTSIEIAIEDKQLLIPIAAVKQEKGKSVVKLQTSNGATSTQIVTTSTALADKVVVASGLKVGDVVAYD